MLKPLNARGKLYLLNLLSVRLKFVFRRVQRKIKLYSCRFELIYVLRGEIASRNEAKCSLNKIYLKFIILKALCRVQFVNGRLRGRLKYKRSSVESQITKATQQIIFCSSSKFILATQTVIHHKKNDKFDSFSFPGIQHNGPEILMKFKITSPAKYGHRSYFT